MTKKILLGVTLMLASPALAHLSPPVAEGNISRPEAVARADALFDALDANHDGYLTLPEAMVTGARLRAQRASTGVDVKPGIGGHTERFLEHRFAGDLEITRRDFEQGMLAHFDRMDRNHDGVLTPAERAEAQ
jgi:hypothetical protein